MFAIVLSHLFCILVREAKHKRDSEREKERDRESERGTKKTESEMVLKHRAKESEREVSEERRGSSNR